MSLNALQGELCAALGLKEVVSLDLRFSLKELPQVTVTYRPTGEAVSKAVEVLKKFELIERKAGDE